MGMGIGISIGWPNASANSGPPLRSGWWRITKICGEDIILEYYTEYQINVPFITGDYVYCPYFGTRVQLGEFITVQPEGQLFAIDSEVYNSCQIYFNINEICSIGVIIKTSTQEFGNGTIYNPGDYVFSSEINNKVLLGEILYKPQNTIINISGPAYNSCEI